MPEAGLPAYPLFGQASGAVARREAGRLTQDSADRTRNTPTRYAVLTLHRKQHDVRYRTRSVSTMSTRTGSPPARALITVRRALAVRPDRPMTRPRSSG